MGSIRAYYDQKNEERREIEVPEWGRTFYIGPLTIGQFERIDQAKTDSERNRMIIVACAKNADGSPALDSQDQEELARYGTTDVVARTAREIMDACAALAGPEKKA